MCSRHPYCIMDSHHRQQFGTACPLCLENTAPSDCMAFAALVAIPVSTLLIESKLLHKWLENGCDSWEIVFHEKKIGYRQRSMYSREKLLASIYQNLQRNQQQSASAAQQSLRALGKRIEQYLQFQPSTLLIHILMKLQNVFISQ